MSNKLLENMKAKVVMISGAQNQLLKMMNGETITLNGIHKMEISTPQTDEARDKNTAVMGKLQAEKDNLIMRIRRMDSNY